MTDKAGSPLAAHEIMELLQEDLVRVEREISLEWVASVEAITTIGRYLQASGGKRLRPSMVLLARNSPAHAARARSGWARWWK